MKYQGELPATSVFGLLFLIAVATLALGRGDSSRPDGSVTFTDITKSSGIHFLNSASQDKRYIVESMGGGVALFDFDNDGLLDIYLVNSYTVEAALANRPRPQAALFRNRGNGTFEDVAGKAGV